jgi:large subunit ribosomal protein L1
VIMAKHGKKYQAAIAKIEKDTFYEPRQALTLVKETSYSKFDSTVEVHMRMGLDPRQADQQLRDVVVMPHGLGKTVRVLVFAQGEGATKAQEAGADYVADSDEWITKIQNGFTDFDVAISTRVDAEPKSGYRCGCAGSAEGDRRIKSRTGGIPPG